jgi:hypothetical protein
MKPKLMTTTFGNDCLRDEPVTIERLERALAVCAHLVVRDGPVVVPIFERLERELAAMRSNEATVVRAKALLAR